MNLIVSFIARYWREGCIIALAITIYFMSATIGHKEDSITALKQDIATIQATSATNDKWQTATSDVLSKVIAEQNAGIARVISAVGDQSLAISQQMDQKRVEDAKTNAALRSYINNLPKATDCSIMMDNFIKNGGAVKW